MPQIDIAMPLALLIVVTTALFLYKRTEKKLDASVETNEFQTKDKLVIVGVVGVIVSVMILAFFINPKNTVGNILTAFFLGSYTTLLFSLTYIFSDLKKKKTQLLSTGFGVASIIVGVASFLEPLQDSYTTVRASAFFALAIISFAIVAYEQRRIDVKKARWHFAIQPPALFLLLFIFFNLLYTEGTLNVWFPYLLNIFGVTFAILIVLYISPLFNWKNVAIFAVLLTILDITLVFSGPMVIAAETLTGLGLPIMIHLPSIPLLLNEAGNTVFRSLGLGDFFFAGILAVQTFKRFGKKYAYSAVAAMVLSFAIWQVFLRDLLSFFDLRGFPATVFIITGWIPIALIGVFVYRKQKVSVQQIEP
jgi:hypothetical protein